MANTYWFNVYAGGVIYGGTTSRLTSILVADAREHKHGIRTLYRIKVTMKEPA